MGTSITSSKVGDYTCDNSLFSWESSTAKVKTLEDSIIVSSNVLTTDEIKISQYDLRQYSLLQKRNLIFSEKLTKEYVLAHLQTINFSETYFDHISFILRILESIAFMELEKNNVQSSSKEKLRLDVKCISSFGIKRSEYLALSDSDKTQTAKMFKEKLTLDSKLLKDSSVKLSELVNILDSKLVDISLVNKEVVGIVEFYFDLITYLLAVNESLNISEKLTRELAVSKEEIIALSPALLNRTETLIKEILMVEPSYSDSISFKRRFNEFVSIVDKVSKTLHIEKKVAIKILESWLRHANATLSDLTFSSTPITLEDFGASLVPAGYLEWKDFQVGDYTYQDALIKIILEASINADRPYIEDWKMNVDVPDIIDMGTAHCTTSNQPLFIPFNKEFHVTPEIIVQIKSGATQTTYLNVISSSKEGFSVELRNEGVYADGYISWSAKGY